MNLEAEKPYRFAVTVLLVLVLAGRWRRGCARFSTTIWAGTWLRAAGLCSTMLSLAPTCFPNGGRYEVGLSALCRGADVPDLQCCRGLGA